MSAFVAPIAQEPGCDSLPRWKAERYQAHLLSYCKALPIPRTVKEINSFPRITEISLLKNRVKSKA
jgi:hypothetical protein